MPQASPQFNQVALRMPFASFHLRGLLSLLLLCGVPATASAEVIARKSFTYFDIKGDTADALDEALNAAGPRTTGGVGMGASSRHPGATKIRFGGSASYAEHDGRCYISGVKVTVDTQIILPRWRDRRHASRQLSMIWNTLAADIRRHEERHAEIARDHARRMEKAILTLPPQASCNTLQLRADTITMTETAAHDAEQARFDRVEAINFQNRMQRLLTYHARQRKEK
jgi:predicted secreted Zn-dependent protease